MRFTGNTLAVALLLLASTAAWAHKVNIFVDVEGDKAVVSGYFSDGKVPMNSPVQVFDLQDNLLLEGQTSQEGEYTFKIPKKESLKVVLDAGMGHRAEYVIPEGDILGDQVEAPADQAGQSPAAAAADGDAHGQGGTMLAPNSLKRMIERAVAKANRPVLRNMDELKKRARLSDILGGFGLIFGGLGIWFYLKARKMQSSQTQ
ncbi:MAG: hypothetical protein D6698_10490 [Gammaproteobacteria bacterium]|nr:MAG: hypothetical protein D6698_10490 [Gammaproteobacteria bacterium]